MKIKISTPLINIILYDALLVATPFLMLQRYLQQTVRETSRLSFEIFGVNVPIALALFSILILLLLLLKLKHLSAKNVSAIFLVFLLIFIGQQTADFYIDYDFYDLQNNWHYLAYAGFALMMRRLLPRDKVSETKYVGVTFVKAFLISAFDEGFQFFMSNRIFDLSDVAKDVWGVLLGMILVLFVFENGKILSGGFKLRHERLKDYLRNGGTLLALELVLGYIFLFVSSIMTDEKYAFAVFGITIAAFAVFFAILHLSRRKAFAIAFIAIFAAGAIVQTAFFFKYLNEYVVYSSKYVTVYKGIPIIYFDAMITPDGKFRLVDKKKKFTGGDIAKIGSYQPYIVVIATGADGSGGMGFPISKYVERPQFIFNPRGKNPMQLARLKNDQAFAEYNRLKKAGKRVLLVIHNE